MKLKIEGWNINQDKKGIYRANRRIHGKVKSIYLGRTFNDNLNIHQKLRRAEQETRILSKPPKRRETFSSKAILIKNRTRLSTPMQYLEDMNLLTGSILDYGCGYGTDANFLLCDRYDSIFYPIIAKRALKNGFDTITCFFILNTIKKPDRIIKKLRSRINATGKIYYAIKNITESVVINQMTYYPVCLESVMDRIKTFPNMIIYVDNTLK